MTDPNVQKREDDMQALIDTIEDMVLAADFKYSIVLESQCGRSLVAGGSDESMIEGLAMLLRGCNKITECLTGEVQ